MSFQKMQNEWVQIYTDPVISDTIVEFHNCFKICIAYPIRNRKLAILNNIVKYEEKVNDYYYNNNKRRSIRAIKEYGAKLFQAEYQNKKAYIGITMNLAEVETLIERTYSKTDEECYVICRAVAKEFYERNNAQKNKIFNYLIKNN